MPIGPITPGSYVTVTADSVLGQYSSVQAPTATMAVIGADVQALTLVVLNVQNFCLQESANGLVRKLDKIDGGTVIGDTVFSGYIDFQGTGVNRPTFQGGMEVVGGELTLDASTTMSSSGTNVFASGSDTSFDGTAVIKTTSGGKFRWDTRNKADVASYTADGTNGYEDILPDPAADRAITLANTGAALGQRKRFNAQRVTSHYWAISYGSQTWFMKNAAGSTVVVEFVYDGSGWVVDQWEEGGNAIRNG